MLKNGVGNTVSNGLVYRESSNVVWSFRVGYPEHGRYNIKTNLYLNT